MRTCKECKAFDPDTSTCRRHAPQPDVVEGEPLDLGVQWLKVDGEKDWCLGGFVSTEYQGQVTDRQWKPKRYRNDRQE